MNGKLLFTLIALTIVALLAVGCVVPTPAPPAEEPAAEEPAAEEPAAEEPAAEMGKWEEPIVIGWTPPDITGVFKTATDFFEASAADGNAQGFDIEVISQSPATHVSFADQVAIIEDYIQRDVDAIAISPIEVEVIKPAVQKANEEGIPVIIVNLLEPIEGLDIDSYIGFDNTTSTPTSASTTRSRPK
jgi:ribose transport system substrate-binding protein